MMNTTAVINGSIRDWDGLNTTMRPLLTFFVVTSLVGNSLVLVLFWRLKRLKTWDNAFNINMTVGNLIASTTAIVLPFTPEFPTVRMMSCQSLRIMQICNGISFLCLVEIALLRYWRVYRPSHVISKSKFLMGLAAPWSIGMFYLTVSLKRASNHNVISCVENAIMLGHAYHLPRLLLIPLTFWAGALTKTVWAPSQYPKRRLFVRSRKVSKPRDWYFKLLYRFEIWQAHRQHRCRSACQISERSDNSKYKSRGFETLRDLTERRLFGYWDGALLSEDYHALQTAMSHPCSEHGSNSKWHVCGIHFWSAICTSDARFLHRTDRRR